MEETKKILFVTSEAAPFAKTGGLADAVSGLSSALSECEVRVFLPLYNKKSLTYFTQYLSCVKLDLPMGEETIAFSYCEMGNVKYYFLDHPLFSERKGIYGESGNAYRDNLLRYSLFSSSIEKLFTVIEWKPDVIHLNDWPTGLVPLFQPEIPCVFTIHNAKHHGASSPFDLARIGISVPKNLIEHYSDGTPYIDMLNCGVYLSKAATTVSPTFSKELINETGSDLFHLSLKDKYKEGLFEGILNGVDESIWNTKADKHLGPYRFSSDDLSGKSALKKELLTIEGFLSDELNLPLFAIIQRLDEQKGFEELLFGPDPVLERLLKGKNSTFIIIGTGDIRYENRLRELATQYPNLRYKNEFSEMISHRCEAAADFFIMPSRFEPCGLTQMYSQLYGTVPIVSKTGGLCDSVVELGQTGESGIFCSPNDPESIYSACQKAIELYEKEPEHLNKICTNGMKRNFSWGKSAKEYEKIYDKLISTTPKAK